VKTVDGTGVCILFQDTIIVYAHPPTHIHSCINVCTNAFMHTHAHTQACARAHTHTHTHTTLSFLNYQKA